MSEIKYGKPKAQMGGSASEVANYVGYNKQIVIDEDNKRIHLMDGKTKGGFSIPNMNDLNNSENEINSYIYSESDFKRNFKDKLNDWVSVKDFGAKGDGVTDDTEAIQKALAFVLTNGKNIFLPSGIYKVSDLLDVPDGVDLIGEGCDYWDLKGSWKPKSMAKGTTLLIYGTPKHTKQVLNVSRMEAAGGVVANDAYSNSGETFDGNKEYSLLDYTNGDAVDENPATPKNLKVAVCLGTNSHLRHLRVQLNYDGIDGYNSVEMLPDFPEYSKSYKGLGDDWDIGVLSYNVDQSGLDNVQVVGYWRMAARACIASNYGDGKSKHGCVFNDNNIFFQGFVGLSIRGNDVHRILSITSNTLEVPWSKSHTVPTSGVCYLGGKPIAYTSSSKVGDKIQLSGFASDISGLAKVGDECYFGSNTGFAGASITNGFITGLNHSTNLRAYDSTLESPFNHPSMAHEISGNPLRDIDFTNVHFFDTDVIGFLHDALHISYIGCYAEAQGFSNGNSAKGARFIASCRPELADANGKYPAGNTRGLYFDKSSEMSDGSVDLYPMYRSTLGRFNGSGKYFMPDAIALFCVGYWGEQWDSVRRYDIGSRVYCNGPNKTFEITDSELTPYFFLKGANDRIGLGTKSPGASLHKKGNEATILMETVGVVDPAIALRNGTESQNTWTIRPQQSSVNQLQARYNNDVRFQILPTDGSINSGADNTATIGSSSFRYKEIFSATGTINTSDEREKTSIIDPDEALMRAWGKVNYKVFQFKEAVEKKGINNARLHIGVIAQQVIEAFKSEGLDATKYGILCYDEWEDQYEDTVVVDKEGYIDENGNTIPDETHIEKKLVLKAGNRYGLRYEECLVLEAVCQRARANKLENKLNEAISTINSFITEYKSNIAQIEPIETTEESSETSVETTSEDSLAKVGI